MIDMVWQKIKIKDCGNRFPGFSFTILTKDNKPTFGRGGCKEYILDAVSSRFVGGGIYDSSYGIVDIDNVRLLCGNEGFPSTIWADTFEFFIHEVENACNLEKTQVFEVEGYPRLFLFIADKRWQLSPPLLSLYATIPRCINSHPAAKTFDQIIEALDKTYGVKQGKFIKLLMDQGLVNMFGEDQKNNWEHQAVHGYGIQSYLMGNLKKIRPHWYDKYDGQCYSSN